MGTFGAATLVLDVAHASGARAENPFVGRALIANSFVLDTGMLVETFVVGEATLTVTAVKAHTMDSHVRCHGPLLLGREGTVFERAMHGLT